ncbi:MAG: hypothetical protein AAF557_22320 [Pseudomonadota bacterium]
MQIETALRALIASVFAVSFSNASVAQDTQTEFKFQFERDGIELKRLDLELLKPLLNSPIRIADFTKGRQRAYERKRTPIILNSNERIKENIAQQIEAGGLSQLASEVLHFPYPDHKLLKLEYHFLDIEIHNNGSADIIAIAKKSFESTLIGGFKIGIWYEWKIFVEPGGIKQGEIHKPIGKFDENGDPIIFNYKYHARAPNIIIKSFKVGIDKNNDDVIDEGEINDVEYFLPNGDVNRLGAVFHPNNSDCIDIDMVVDLDGNGKPVDPNNPKHLMFCAGSCSGYLLAATNGA